MHVIDGMSAQPAEEFEAVRLELQLFNPILSEKPFVVAFNKTDVPEAAERWDDFQQRLRSEGIEPLSMSAATGRGSSEVMSAAHALLKEQKESGLEDYIAGEISKWPFLWAIVGVFHVSSVWASANESLGMAFCLQKSLRPWRWPRW